QRRSSDLRQRFNTVQLLGAKNIAEAAKPAGIRMTHVSSLAADANSPSDYARTKAEGEKAILSVLPDSVILRPSIIFGPEDRFFNRFANMARFSPFLPAIGGGETKLQPAYVGDVAGAVALAVDGRVAGGGIYEPGGPDVQPVKNWMKDMLGVIGGKRAILSMPRRV